MASGLAVGLAGCHLIFPFESIPSDGQAVLDATPVVDRSDLDVSGDVAAKDAPAADTYLDGPVVDAGPAKETAPAPDTVPWPDAPAADTVPWPDAPLPDTVPPADTVPPDGYLPPPPLCTNPVKLANLDSTDKDDGPHLSTDGLRLYFSSSRPGGPGINNIWWAERTSLGAAFNPPQLLQNVNAANVDQGDPSLDKDELVIVLERLEKANKDIFEATRTSRFIPFNPPVIVTALKTNQDDEDPALSPDGLTIVFSSNRSGGMGDSDLYVATRTSRIAPFANITPLATLNSSEKDADPAFGGPHYLVFDSHRGGLTTPDLFIAVRTGWGAPFNPPVPIANLNSNALDGDPFLEPNVKRILFEHDQGGGDTAIYECTY